MPDTARLTMKVGVCKIPIGTPDDVSSLRALVDNGEVDPREIVAIMGKTEGNGCVNDFTRGFCIASIRAYLQSVGVNDAAPVYVMSGGTEGVLSPHLTIFTKQQQQVTTLHQNQRRLAIGVHHTRALKDEEIGSIVMVEVVRDGVLEALSHANLTPEHVHFVQIKCPLSRMGESYKSMAMSRGASSLGVALALGEIDSVSPQDIGANWDLYSSVASASAGLELSNCEILVLGNSETSQSDFVMGHSVMRHVLDVSAVDEAFASAGVSNRDALVNVFAKAEADPSGRILGCRHTMMDDSDIAHTRMARAVVGAAVAAVVQDPMIYVSGGAEHQGPSGGGPIAVICRQPFQDK